MGLFRGLGIVFKDLSRCIKGKEAGKWSWTFIILSKSVSWLSRNREPRFLWDCWCPPRQSWHWDNPRSDHPVRILGSLQSTRVNP